MRLRSVNGGEVSELRADVVADTIDVRHLIEQVRVNLQRRRRGRVAELPRDERDISAGGNHDRGTSVAQIVNTQEGILR